MKIHDFSPIKFTAIYTESDPAPPIKPDKTPYLIFELPNFKFNFTNLVKLAYPLNKLGTVTADKNNLYLTITSAKNISYAIELFEKYWQKDATNRPSNYSINSAVRQELKKLKSRLNPDSELELPNPDASKLPANQELEPEKAPASSVVKPTLPSKTKALSKYTISTKQIALSKSAHSTQFIQRKNAKGEVKNYVQKFVPSQRNIIEIESFNSFCYRLLLNKRAAKARTAIDEKDQRTVISSLIINYQSLANFLKANKSITIQQIIDMKLCHIWVAAYCEEENDLHTGNYGINENGESVKIDSDQATISVTAKYINYGTFQKDPKTGKRYFNIFTQDINKIQQEIRNFPILIYSIPNNWPYIDKNRNLPFDIDALRNDPEYNSQKYYMFLKRILITSEVYAAAANATIKPGGTQQYLVDVKARRTEVLKQALITMPEFQDYLANNPAVIDTLVAEFKEYNQEHKNDKNSYLHVDLTAIEKNFHAICDAANQEKSRFNPTFLPK